MNDDNIPSPSEYLDPPGPTCPECESAEMREDDHVWVCPRCGWEESDLAGYPIEQDAKQAQSLGL